MTHRVPVAALAALFVWTGPAGAADETSSGDKLRMLYSNQFTFTDDGLPVVTIELASGLDSVVLSGKEGLVVKPDGDSGSEIHAGAKWTLRVEDAEPAELREWTIVSRHHPDRQTDIEVDMQAWRQRGYSVRAFEVGTLFGVSGATLDSRETLIGIDPVAPGKGSARAEALARKHRIDTEVHTEVVRLPRGVVVASSGAVTVRNPSVMWFMARTKAATVTVHDIEVGGGGSQLSTQRETRHYWGSVFATVGKDGKLVVVNAVSTDRLLAGIVPSEIFPSSPPAALQAQAVAARTELIEKLGRRHFGDPFLLCSTQRCQVYSGAGKEDARTTAAVKATRGMVLMGEGGRLVDARYSASCGGHTESKENIWGGKPDPHLGGLADAIPGTTSARKFASGIDESNVRDFLAAPASDFYEGKTRLGKGRFRWTVDKSAEELSRLVADHYPGLGRVLALEPMERGRSGRIRKIRIRGTEGEVVASGDLHLRRMFGGLRSSLFVVEPMGARARPDSFVFRGAGFGHGVGMCQIGAIGMAEHQRSAEQILRHYYRGSTLQRLY